MITATRRFGALVSAVALTLAVAACGSEAGADSGSTPSAASVEIEDNNGKLSIATPPKSVVATDNRTFQTLADWNIKLSAAAVGLMPDTISYTKDTSIVNLGDHGEPDLEALVGVQPDLIVNGQRFTQFHKDMAKLVPEAKIVELDPRDGQPFDAELKRQTTTLGEIFGKQDDAKKLNDALDASVARVKAAYKPTDTVMAVNSSGGKIGYIAPSVGRTLGPVFDLAGLTPALKVASGSDDHQGDDISVEAIAKANPDWILVMDRDAAVNADDPKFTPADQVIAKSEALKSVNAVKNGNIVYMPKDTYINEGIQTYTEFFNSFADALEARK